MFLVDCGDCCLFAFLREMNEMEMEVNIDKRKLQSLAKIPIVIKQSSFVERNR